MTEPRPPSLDCQDYTILAMVQGSLGEPPIELGVAGRCRYCGATDRSAFQSVAHTFPEGFGNKWITSLDECDACNARFGTFDDALAKSLGAVLTVGGTQGKKNKVRQTGRSEGPASIRHSVVDGRRAISMRVNGTPMENHFGVIPATGEFVFQVPGGTERFVPAKAYKGLVKMALALMPEKDLASFAGTISWLQAPDADLRADMTVGLSFAMVGNAPPLLAAALLRRTTAKPELPEMIFVTTLGSICLQIALNPDAPGKSEEPLRQGRPAIAWTNVLEPPGIEPISIAYGQPVHLDWARAELELPAVEAIRTIVNPRTGEGRMVPILRQSALAAAP